MLDELKERVCLANKRLVAEGLVLGTFGNVSGVDRSAGCMVIKPSGLDYDHMAAGDMVVVSLATGQPVDAKLRPSSDTLTHLELYRAFDRIGGVAHTHSTLATAWAQAGREIPAYGTTHADYFPGPVPCTRLLTAAEIAADYETNTGKVIVERLAQFLASRPASLPSPDPLLIPGLLVARHGPFTWADSADGAVANAAIIEYLANLAMMTERINPACQPAPDELLIKHFLRKHGPKRYYGQGPAKP